MWPRVVESRSYSDLYIQSHFEGGHHECKVEQSQMSNDYYFVFVFECTNLFQSFDVKTKCDKEKRLKQAKIGKAQIATQR